MCRISPKLNIAESHQEESRKIKMSSEKMAYDPAVLLSLLDLLLDVYHAVRPKTSDYEHRQRLFQMLTNIATETFTPRSGFPVVQALGSFTMDLFTPASDLDLSVNFNNGHATFFPHSKKIWTLRTFAKALYAHRRKGHISTVLPLLKARVPTIKVVDPVTGIGCDITVENKDGISRSLIFSIVSSIDGRFRILSYLMKVWAKKHGINSSQERTLNSVSIITIVVLHLQTRDPPILPPLSTLLRNGTDVESVRRVALGFSHFGRRNKETVAELFDALLRNLALLESSWQHGLCASTFEGSWISRKWKPEVAFMGIEDFLDRSENFARAVGKAGLQKIYRSVWNSVYYLSRFMEGQIEASELKVHLFGLIPSSKQRTSNEGTGFKRALDGDLLEPARAKRVWCSEASDHPESSVSTSRPGFSSWHRSG